MILSLNSLVWDTTSPSHYKLVLPRDTGDSLDIAFVGDCWLMFQEYNGTVHSREFDSRDEAMAMVQQAFKNVGVI